MTGAISIPYFIVFSFEVVTSAMFNNFQYTLHTLLSVPAAYDILFINAEVLGGYETTKALFGNQEKRVQNFAGDLDDINAYCSHSCRLE